MFDAVRILSSPATDNAGYSGAEGVLFGFTTVSVTGVLVVGEIEDDCALNVDFDGKLPSAWFQPSLVEFIDRPETTITIGPETLTRAANSDEWIHIPRKPWWKFWT